MGSKVDRQNCTNALFAAHKNKLYLSHLYLLKARNFSTPLAQSISAYGFVGYPLLHKIERVIDFSFFRNLCFADISRLAVERSSHRATKKDKPRIWAGFICNMDLGGQRYNMPAKVLYCYGVVVIGATVTYADPAA